MSVSTERLDRYELHEKLGVGGMARVYKAWDTQLQRFVAIKILHEHLADDPTFKERFEREARFVAAFNHPHIVQVYDFSMTRWRGSIHYYMVMSYIAGDTLRTYLEDTTHHPIPVPQTLRFMQHVSSALGYAHARGMIHRDVKPGNIMIDLDNNAILTDFGIARFASAARFTQEGLSTGTPAYMSPEQAVGGGGDARSDLYSLGVILFEMLTGSTPYSDESQLALMLKQVNQDIPLPSQRLGRPNPALDTFMKRALAKLPEDRFEDAQTFMSALSQVFPNIVLPRPPTAGDDPPPLARMNGTTAPEQNTLVLNTTIGQEGDSYRTQAAQPGTILFAPTRLLNTLSQAAAAHPKTSTGFFVFTGLVLLVLAGTLIFSRVNQPQNSSTASMTQSTYFRSSFSPIDLSLSFWPTDEDGLLTRAFIPDEGVYRLGTEQVGTAFSTLYAAGTDYEDVLIELKGSLDPTSDPATAYGIIFRYQDPGNYNVFAVDGQGRYSIWVRQGGIWRELRGLDNENWTPNASIHRIGEGQNRLSIAIVDDVLSAYVNFTVVTTLKETTFNAGGVGIYFATDAAATQQAAVDIDSFQVSDSTSSMTGG